MRYLFLLPYGLRIICGAGEAANGETPVTRFLSRGWYLVLGKASVIPGVSGLTVGVGGGIIYTQGALLSPSVRLNTSFNVN